MAVKHIILDGKTSETKSSTLLELFQKEARLPYSENPIVAATVNGVLTPLQQEIKDGSEISPIRLFSPFGKRVYRKSLCMLLLYASQKLYNDKTLVIGHSLGDGFYFSYRDHFKADAAALEAKMREAIAKDEEIQLVTLSDEEAEEHVKRNKLTETEKLLETEGFSSYSFFSLSGVLAVDYEPMLPYVKTIDVWELREYQDGLLLRYPQSRHKESILPFTDNPLLFSVFKENKKIAENIGLESLGALNIALRDRKIEEAIVISEAMMHRRISNIADDIKKRGTVKIVTISGPSSSGKTTFSLKLSMELKALGFDPIKISLDDYYLTDSFIPLDDEGKRDYEVLEALNLELFKEQIDSLLKGEEVHLASFSFKKKETTFREESVKLKENSIVVIEGIHGLNPKLFEGYDEHLIYKIYISALTQLNLDSRSRISTTDNRILRRIVRDSRTRGTSVTETLKMWPSVEQGEKNHIFPYQNNADAMINSALEYELGVLALYAIPLLKSVKKESGEAFTNAQRLLSFLSFVYPISPESVPNDSILREFIGGSVFSVI